ncbi:hypothetical protein [Dyadobacter arcticus]|uniref:Uncharacterized protein n=1 Tax=Dyadobacter arcticus TaxID=1078754 RepID=A0ABX0URD6_9BACT|nr:hypothetical protein [Dyadobacter arcticus]NIJ55531.1 hypothetical protein [Dyadobacter arcticus]
MKLVQKLPIGLSLACVMMMSGCSKEELQTPEPKVESVNTHSNLKTDALPWIAPTKAYAGIKILPNFWERRSLDSGDPVKYPFGTSNFSRPWGNIALQWKESFPALQGQPWNSFVTVTSTTTDKSNSSKMAKVGTTIQFLKTGFTYYLTFYVASARPKLDGSGKLPTFVGKCNIALKSPNTGQYYESQYFDVNMLEAQPNTWIKKTIEFKATNSEMRFDFSATSIQDGKTAYAHLFIGQDAIWEKRF